MDCDRFSIPGLIVQTAGHGERMRKKERGGESVRDRQRKSHSGGCKFWPTTVTQKALLDGLLSSPPSTPRRVETIS